jgi:hypothetical protein
MSATYHDATGGKLMEQFAEKSLKKPPYAVVGGATPCTNGNNSGNNNNNNKSMVAGGTTQGANGSNSGENNRKKKSTDAIEGDTTSSAVGSKKKSPDLGVIAFAQTSTTGSSFPVGPFLPGKYCFAPTHELCKKCPGCGNNIHIICGCV